MRTVALSDYAEVFNGKTPSKAEQRESGHPVLKIRDVDDKGQFRQKYESFVDPAFAQKFAKKQVKAGDTLILNAAHNADYVGSKSFFATVEVDGAIATGEWLIVRPRSDTLDARFASHWLTSDQARREIRELVKGIHLYPKDVARLSIPLPPLDEQKRIAAILDQADELRRKRQRAIDRLNQLGQAIFHEMFGDIGGLARTHSFEDVATIQQSLVDPKQPEHRSKLHVGPEHIASGVGIVAWENVSTAEEDNVISGKNWFKAGDVIYSKIRPYLNKVAIVDRDGLCSADMYVIQPVPQKSNTAFLRTLLMGRDFLAYAETCSNRANIPKLNRKQVESYRFHCPSFEAQSEFAERVADIEMMSTPFKVAAKTASNLFASLQHRAFRGEI